MISVAIWHAFWTLCRPTRPEEASLLNKVNTSVSVIFTPLLLRPITHTSFRNPVVDLYVYYLCLRLHSL